MPIHLTQRESETRQFIRNEEVSNSKPVLAIHFVRRDSNSVTHFFGYKHLHSKRRTQSIAVRQTSYVGETLANFLILDSAQLTVRTILVQRESGALLVTRDSIFFAFAVRIRAADALIAPFEL